MHSSWRNLRPQDPSEEEKKKACNQRFTQEDVLSRGSLRGKKDTIVVPPEAIGALQFLSGGAKKKTNSAEPGERAKNFPCEDRNPAGTAVSSGSANRPQRNAMTASGRRRRKKKDLQHHLG